MDHGGKAIDIALEEFHINHIHGHLTIVVWYCLVIDLQALGVKLDVISSQKTPVRNGVRRIIPLEQVHGSKILIQNMPKLMEALK